MCYRVIFYLMLSWASSVYAIEQYLTPSLKDGVFQQNTSKELNSGGVEESYSKIYANRGPYNIAADIDLLWQPLINPFSPEQIIAQSLSSEQYCTPNNMLLNPYLNLYLENGYNSYLNISYCTVNKNNMSHGILTKVVQANNFYLKLTVRLQFTFKPNTIEFDKLRMELNNMALQIASEFVVCDTTNKHACVRDKISRIERGIVEFTP